MDGKPGGLMKTRITSSPRSAASTLRRGGLVAFPTETVYGLGADAFNASAVKKIFIAKGRPADNPLIVHLGSPEDIAHVAAKIPPAAKKLIKAFFPGPLTVVVRRHPDVPALVSAGLDTIGVRCPAHARASAFLRACGTPVAAPSANRSGRPSPTTWSAVRDELSGRIDCILKGLPARVGLESTVVDCTARVPVILREGAVTVEALRKIIPDIRVPSGKKTPSHKVVRSPGMKYRHYAPHARVVLVDGPARAQALEKAPAAYIGLTRRGLPPTMIRARVCRSVEGYARALFQFFRACERAGVRVIYCQRVASSGLGRALMDRLRKAADDHPTDS